ncbi:4-phosphopantetheinyl transferase [Nocardiopsis gilva YIM 90087]|uniref:4-phosphopantetheinyl transferase n=1 Tax=Nocardiopsis gilva YIM 90087 TaxID=1235441 RepID=A0A223SDP1_9ACTN|nr:4-phosphopantetheinyl transferase [Nocardiopsis gilva YIM 90087]
MTCEVWWADPAQAHAGLLDLLDDQERARHARFRLAADRDRFVVAHALARLVCAQRAGCAPEDVRFTLHCRNCELRREPRTDPHGKPRPAGPALGLEISISHSGDRVVLAVADGIELGVDVEAVAEGRDIDGLASYTLTGDELAVWRALPAAQRTPGFFRYWARKEALLKATGDGLSGGLGTVGVTGPDDAARLVAWDAPDAPTDVWLTDLDAGTDYRAALAALAPGPIGVTTREAGPLLRSR